ncbi:MAG: DUF502 domain-containing protein [Planctomycetales bacterium]
MTANMPEKTGKQKSAKGRPRPFRRAVLRGLAVMLPPLLTIVIFVWIGNTVNVYVMQPVKLGARHIVVWAIEDDVKSFPDLGIHVVETEKDGVEYHRLPKHTNGQVNSQWIPSHVYYYVTRPENTKGQPVPTTRLEIYNRYVDLRWLTPSVVVPVFLCIFILTMYLLGKFLAAGMGRLALGGIEKGIDRLPVIRHVYGSVKQVTDFIFSESNVEYTRVIAIEYPRRGIWSLGMVTGESMLDIASAANEPVLSVLVPTSPAPFTGFTVTIKKSEAVDLNLTIDQAFQFIVSCGVVVAPQQVRQLSGEEPRATEATLPVNPDTPSDPQPTE